MTSKTEKARQTRQRNLAAQQEKEQAATAEKNAIRAALPKALEGDSITPGEAVRAAQMLLKLNGG